MKMRNQDIRKSLPEKEEAKHVKVLTTGLNETLDNLNSALRTLSEDINSYEEGTSQQYLEYISSEGEEIYQFWEDQGTHLYGDERYIERVLEESNIAEDFVTEVES